MELQAMFTSLDKTDHSLILVASLCPKQWCISLLLSVCKLLNQFPQGLWKAWSCHSSPVLQLTPSSSSLSLAWTNLSSKLIWNTRIHYQKICEQGGGSDWSDYLLQMICPALALQTVCNLPSSTVWGCGGQCVQTQLEKPLIHIAL